MLETKPKIFIEFGAADPCVDVSQYPDTGFVLDEIAKVREVLGEFVDIEFCPYDSTDCLLSGGRKSNPDLNSLKQYIEDFNEKGIPFMVPFNGGLGLSRGVELDLDSYHFDTEREVMELLADNSAKYGVQNGVTVLRDELRRYVMDRLDGVLDVGASCIRFVGGRRGEFRGMEEYDIAFRDFDHVVPLNQHTTFEFLHRYREHAGKMLLLLNSTCSSQEMLKCYTDYLGYQSALVLHHFGEEEEDPSPEEFDCISNASFPYTRDCRWDNYGILYDREEDLKPLMEMGVSRFKIPRRQLFNPIAPACLERLVEIFIEVREATEPIFSSQSYQQVRT